MELSEKHFDILLRRLTVKLEGLRVEFRRGRPFGTDIKNSLGNGYQLTFIRKWMGASLRDILNINDGGHPIHEQRENGNMQRELRRILTRNSRRTSRKYMGSRRIKKDLALRGIFVSHQTIVKCLRKDLHLKPCNFRQTNYLETGKLLQWKVGTLQWRNSRRAWGRVRYPSNIWTIDTILDRCILFDCGPFPLSMKFNHRSLII